ncbi:hypothetical protein IKP85_04940 [bacterium]|nr:hypothetical protein [bacterium]
MSFQVQSFSLILEVPESEFIITGLDMEFKVSKSIRAEADFADVIVWNLDEDSYKQLIHKDRQIRLYAKSGNEDAKLLFAGYSNKNFITRRRISVCRTNNEAAPPDIVTSLKLVESRTTYDNSYINENYQERVSAEQIIKDCISAMGLGNFIINTDIPEKYYPSFKAKGRPHCVLQEICNSLGLEFVIQNGIVIIGAPDENHTENDIPELNSSNALDPQYQSNNEVLIITSLNTEILPNNLVRCNFENLSGVLRVFDVVSEGNNFDTASTTYITAGIEK